MAFKCRHSFSLEHILIGLSIVANSCSDNAEPDSQLSDGFNIRIGSSVTLTKSEIDYYDHSSHLIYLKKGVYLDAKTLKDSKFWVLCGKECIYDGVAFCSNADSIELDSVTLRYENNQVNYIQLFFLQDFQQIYSHVYDPRNNDRIKQALKDDGIYHPGLTCEIDTIIRMSTHDITLKLKLTNSDSFNYYYFDPDKMDFNEYHYFTNGLSLYQWNPFALYRNNVSTLIPEMNYCCWGEDWISLIKSGETKILNMKYTDFDEFPPGTYCAVYRFHGEMIKPASGSNIFDYGRMWLGDIQLAQKVTIE
jgi:hypothetical protein